VLLYGIEMGATEQRMAQQFARSGQPIPDRILNAPRLRLGLALYLNAFYDLNTERQQGFTVGRISWLAMKQYAEFHKFDEEQSEYLIYFLQAMDSAYLKHSENK
jgi:hypothetical protein